MMSRPVVSPYLTFFAVGIIGGLAEGTVQVTMALFLCFASIWYHYKSIDQ